MNSAVEGLKVALTRDFFCYTMLRPLMFMFRYITFMFSDNAQSALRVDENHPGIMNLSLQKVKVSLARKISFEFRIRIWACNVLILHIVNLSTPSAQTGWPHSREASMFHQWSQDILSNLKWQPGDIERVDTSDACLRVLLGRNFRGAG